MSRRRTKAFRQMARRLRVLEAQLDDERGENTRLRFALDATGRAVLVCDGQGDVRYRNETAAALVDARHGDALAAKAVDEALVRARTSGSGDVRTLELHGPPARTLVITASALGTAPATFGAVAVVEDVTRRRQLESVRSDFVANVSHELRTPIGAIGLLAETLVDETDTAVLRRLSARINREADRVAQIINELLDLSRIEGGAEETLEPVCINGVVGAAVERVRAAAANTGVTVGVGSIAGDVRVLGHQTQLVSAVSNLVDNAVKYSDPGGRVDVAVAVADWVDVLVRDHGIGIPPRDLDRIFERFYRVDRARSRATGGTGLGLSIARHVAQNHGGEIMVTSREGEGSVFTLRLPRLAR